MRFAYHGTGGAIDKEAFISTEIEFRHSGKFLRSENNLLYNHFLS